MSQELKSYLTERGVATSRTTPYHPMGNGQCERYNGIIWKSVLLGLKSNSLPDSSWEIMLPEALHSIRSLLSTSTNTTPHERFFGFERRSPCGDSLPSWLMAPGPVMLRRFVRTSKNDALVDKVVLTDVNHAYASIRHADGRESTVSLKDLSLCPADNTDTGIQSLPTDDLSTASPPTPPQTLPAVTPPPASPQSHQAPEAGEPEHSSSAGDRTPPDIRRSSRVSREPARYGW